MTCASQLQKQLSNVVNYGKYYFQFVYYLTLNWKAFLKFTGFKSNRQNPSLIPSSAVRIFILTATEVRIALGPTYHPTEGAKVALSLRISENEVWY